MIGRVMLGLVGAMAGWSSTVARDAFGRECGTGAIDEDPFQELEIYHIPPEPPGPPAAAPPRPKGKEDFFSPWRPGKRDGFRGAGR